MANAITSKKSSVDQADAADVVWLDAENEYA